MLLGLPPGLLAQVVSSQLSDFKLRGSSPYINTYPAQKKKGFWVLMLIHPQLLMHFSLVNCDNHKTPTATISQTK